MKAELAQHHEVVGEAATPSEALAVIAETHPDVVLLDVHLPDGGGVAVLEALPARRPPKVLALSVSDAAEDVVPMIRAGALGYVTLIAMCTTPVYPDVAPTRNLPWGRVRIVKAEDEWWTETQSAWLGGLVSGWSP